MKIHLWSVGKSHDAYVRDGIEDFMARIGRYFPVSFKIIAPPKNAASMLPDEQKKKEAESILNMLRPDDYLVLLDEKGKTMDSPGLASFLQSRANENCKTLIFLIGGAFGSDVTVNTRAKFVWSLSALTFPHQLVRLILAEQVYRACTIMRNEKYHHE